ncbi:uncharacterized protein [Antedon mediterranea]|uniref:uncharacterized protein n=1 Tax=Antedon mediterranea TaxID=105859 RepID=UPI003AF70DB6
MHLLVGVVIFFVFNNEAHCQLVTSSNQEAKEGDVEVVMTCDYSQFTSTTPDAIQWDELNDGGVNINPGIVNTNKVQNGRFRLDTAPGKASLVMSQPMRNDSQRIFQCQIKTISGEIQLSNPSILTVYYLDQPFLDASATTVYEGSSVTFTCSKPEGDPVPDNTIWYKDGQTVNTNETSRYEIANNSMSESVKIKSATEEDGGRYTCKAESDQFKGDDAKTSEGKQLTVIGYYITVTFTSENGLATCTAEGHPKPSSVWILQDGKVVDNGENRATIQINDEICKSHLECYAENGKITDLITLLNCDAGSLSPHTIMIIITVVLIPVVVVIPTASFLVLLVYQRKRRSRRLRETYKRRKAGYKRRNKDGCEETALIERPKTQSGREPVTIYSNVTAYDGQKDFKLVYLPNLVNSAKISNIAWYKQFKDGAQALLTSLQSPDPTTCYECGFVDKKRSKVYLKIGVVEFKDAGKYICEVQVTGVQEVYDCPGMLTLIVKDVVEMKIEDVHTYKQGIAVTLFLNLTLFDNAAKISSIEWYKHFGDKPDILLTSRLKRRYQCGFIDNNTGYFEIKKVNYGDAGIYICKVKVHGREKTYECYGKLTVEAQESGVDRMIPVGQSAAAGGTTERESEKKPTSMYATTTTAGLSTSTRKKLPYLIRMDIPEVITNEGVNYVKLMLFLTWRDDSAIISNIKWYKQDKDGAKKLLTSLQSPDPTSRYQCEYLDSKYNVFFEVKNVVSEDAGIYKCEVQVEGIQKAYSCSGKLTVQAQEYEVDETTPLGQAAARGTTERESEKKPTSMYATTTTAELSTSTRIKLPYLIRMDIPDVITNEGVNYVKLILFLTWRDDSAKISSIKWYKQDKDGARMLLTSLQSPDPTSRYQCEYLDSKYNVCFEVKNVVCEDAGEYICEMQVEERQKIYSCSGRLTVEAQQSEVDPMTPVGSAGGTTQRESEKEPTLVYATTTATTSTKKKLPYTVTVHLKSTKGPPHPQYVVDMFEGIFGEKDVIHAEDLPDQSDKVKELVQLIKDIGFTINSLERNCIRFHLCPIHPRAVLFMWNFFTRGRFLSSLSEILVPEEHQPEFIDQWNLQMDEPPYEVETITSEPSSQATAFTKYGTTDINSLIVEVDTFWGELGDVNLLKLLLYEFKSNIALIKIQNGEDAHDLFRLLIGPGIISDSDVTVLIEAVFLACLFGLASKIKDRLVPSFEGFEGFVVHKFSKYRQDLITFGLTMCKKTWEKLQKQYYSIKPKDHWDLIFNLEINGKLKDLVQNIDIETPEYKILLEALGTSGQ